jgi:hypothetical protein
MSHFRDGKTLHRYGLPQRFGGVQADSPRHRQLRRLAFAIHH